MRCGSSNGADAQPVCTVLFPFKMMTIEGSYVGILDDLRELLAVVLAKVPPIPVETRRPRGEGGRERSEERWRVRPQQGGEPRKR
jgi:hypothetical protein